MIDSNETDSNWYEVSHEMKEVNEVNVENEEKEVVDDNIPGDIENQKLKKDDIAVLKKDDIVTLKNNTNTTVQDTPTQSTASVVTESRRICQEPNLSPEYKGCMHHDMADDVMMTSQETNQYKKLSHEQCTHSDAMKLGKHVKVNRVSPFRYGDLDSGNLLIDLTNNPALDSDKESKMKTKGDQEKTGCNGFSEDLDISQERYSTDLPRHNWLVKRLKQQNQIKDGDIMTLHTVVNDKDIKIDDKKTDSRNYNNNNNDGKPNDTSQLTKPTPSSTQHPPQDTTENTSPIPPDCSSPDEKEHTGTDTSHSMNMQESKPHASTSGSTTPHSPFINNFVSSSSSSSSSQTKPVTETGLKPILVMSYGGMQHPTPAQLPDIDLSSLKYDSLSRFNSSPKQRIQPSFHHSSPSESYLIQRHNENRYMRDVTRPIPLHLKESYKSEQDVYGLNHRVRLSVTPLATTTTKDKMTFRNQGGGGLDKSASMMKSYEALPSSNLASPEVIKRNVAIQRQLENQKRWIAEHEPFKSNAANKYGEYNEEISNQSLTSPLNPNIQSSSRFPSQGSEDSSSSYSVDNLTLLQGKEYLIEKIDACNKEIKVIQQQKDVLFARQQGIPNPEYRIPNTDSPNHLRIITLNRKLSSLEDYRMKQSALLMKLEAQPYEQRSHDQRTHDQRSHDQQRSHVSIKKQGYIDVNGGLVDAEELQGKQRQGMNTSDLSDNLLLRQLQSKHDEGVSMVTMATDCRTIDLSKTSEMFYNDMRMENVPTSQPSTPNMKEYTHTGDVPPLVSAERLSPANGYLPRKPTTTTDCPRGHALPYSKSPEVPRPLSLTHTSQLFDTQRSHDILHSFNSLESLMSRDPSRHLQYEKLVRARDLQHSMQDTSRGVPRDVTHTSQIQDRQHLRPRSLNPQELTRSQNNQEMLKSRELPYPLIQGSSNEPTHYSPVSLPMAQPYPDSPSDDVRSLQYSKEMTLKRQRMMPARPGQLKLARTIQNSIHQINASQMDRGVSQMDRSAASHMDRGVSQMDRSAAPHMDRNAPQMDRNAASHMDRGVSQMDRNAASHMDRNAASQMDRKCPKILQHDIGDNKYTYSNIPSIINPGEMVDGGSHRNRYELMAQSHPSSSMSDFEHSNTQRQSYHPDKKKVRVRTCKACDKESQFLCSGCRGIWYCSRQCQLDDWKVHSKCCRKK